MICVLRVLFGVLLPFSVRLSSVLTSRVLYSISASSGLKELNTRAIFSVAKLYFCALFVSSEVDTFDGVIPSFRFGSDALPLSEGDTGESITGSEEKSTLGRISREGTTLGTDDTWVSGITDSEGDTIRGSDDTGVSGIALGKDPSLGIVDVELPTSTTGEDATGLAGGLVESGHNGLGMDGTSTSPESFSCPVSRLECGSILAGV